MIELNLAAALPELFLACAGMVLLMVGVFNQTLEGARTVYWLSIAVLTLATFGTFAQSLGTDTAFGGVFVSDSVSRFAKIFLFGSSAVILLLAREYLENAKLMIFEFPVLIIFAVLGMAMMVSSADLISLYVGLELQSLSLYVLASFRRDSVRSTEAGLKYFVLGALSSGLLLFGASYIYGVVGSTLFSDISSHVSAAGTSVALLIGIALMIAGLAFKISAAPFHMWTPDVYEGAPTPVTAFFATAPKMAAAVLFMRVLYDGFLEVPEAWSQSVALLAAVSMLLGGVAAIGQTDIKRLMAYSSIGHMGFALVGLAAGTELGARSVLVYLAIYVIMNLGVFAYILTMRRDGVAVTQISELSGLWERDGVSALCLSVLMFSLAGIPPLAGFWAKWYVFSAAVEAELIWLLIVAVFGTVISAFYYLRLVKIMLFDEGAAPFDERNDRSHGAVLMASAAFIVLFILGGLGLTGMATEAAAIYAP